MIEVEHLTKRYGGHTAVEDISFTVEDGCIYGLLGPNGAGKSTTMNIITGYISATDGTVRIDGHDIAEEPAEAKACIGYLPELPPLYPEMTTREYLLFVAELKGTRKKADRIAAVEHAAARAGLQGMEQRLIRNLSKGYRQRVGIAAALLGTPKVIILDEPTVGLDPAQMIEIRSLIRDLGKTHTVILSSHILSEVQSVCDRVLIIAHGRLVAQGTPEELAACEAIRAGLSGNFCRRCGYCAPCTVGIDIPGIFTLENYLKHYDLADWARSRYESQTARAGDCIGCGKCEERCPYELPIREKLKGVAKAFGA